MLEWIDSHGIVAGIIQAIILWLFAFVVGCLPSANELKEARPNLDPLVITIYKHLMPKLQDLAANSARTRPGLRLFGNSKSIEESK